MTDQEIKQIFYNNTDCYASVEDLENDNIGPSAMSVEAFLKVVTEYFINFKFEYPWHEAPPWAEFAATDKDGTRCWFSTEPLLMKSNKMWNCIGQYTEIVPKPEPQSLWKHSLQKRPVTNKQEKNVD